MKIEITENEKETLADLVHLLEMGRACGLPVEVNEKAQAAGAILLRITGGEGGVV